MSNINNILFSTNGVNAAQKINSASGTGNPVVMGKVQPVPGKCYFGAWLGIAPDDNAEDKKGILDEFNQKRADFGALTGKSPKIVMMFEQWSDTWKYNPFPSTFCREVDMQKQIPLITWEPSGLPFKPTDDKSTYLDEFNKQFANKKGEIYEYAKKWATESKAYGKSFLLRPFHEMNLQYNYSWTAWMNGGKEGIEKFKKAWQNLYTLFKEVGATNATFVWCPNTTGYPIEDWNKIKDYFPGAEYVDWIGVDGYRKSNIEPAMEKTDHPKFDAVFGGSIKDLNDLSKKYNKPLMICETSSIPDGGKAEYIKQLFDAAKEYKMSAVVWFNENKKGQGGDEENWLIDAPVTSEAENINAANMAILAGAKTKADSTMIMQLLGIKEPKKLTSQDENPALKAFRDAGKDNYLMYGAADITLNTKGVNQETKRTVRIPKQKIALDGEVKKLSRYQSWIHYVLPLPGKEADVNMMLASYQEELSGYQYLKAINHDEIKVLDEIGKQHQLAIDVLKKVPDTDRDYLKALSAMKDIYAAWDTNDNIKKKEYEAKAESISKEIIRLTKDKKYIASFNNAVISREVLGGTLNSLDVTRYKELELLGYQASAHATIANLHVESADKKVNPTEYEIAYKEFSEAQRILNSEEFKRGQFKESLADSSSKPLEEKMYGNGSLWQMPGKAYYSAINWISRDPNKDLKASINIGLAKLKCVDPSTLDAGIKELEDIAYNTHGISPNLKIQAKVELAKALAKYAGMAQEIEHKNPVLYKQYMVKAKKSLVIARELFATAYAYKAGQLLETLSKQIKE
jgi:mannan endo-1,4-beta-mannosidase